jgi:hypothetical protein
LSRQARWRHREQERGPSNDRHHVLQAAHVGGERSKRRARAKRGRGAGFWGLGVLGLWLKGGLRATRPICRVLRWL